MASESVRVEIEEGGILLGKEQAEWVRKALLLGLASFGAVVQSRSEAERMRLCGETVPHDLVPTHPNGSSDVVSDFATALMVLR